MKLLKGLLTLTIALGGVLLTIPTSAQITAQVDTTAPEAPTNMGGFPATSTASDAFTIFWKNPVDESGIAAAYYKFDTAPTSNTDGTRVAPVIDPTNNANGILQNIVTGGRTTRTIYVWLEDGLGLIDYTKYASATLYPEGALDDLLRVAGADRFITSTETSKKIFPAAKSASAVILANGLSNADALAGVPLGFMANAPTLLIQTNAIPQVVWNEVLRVLPAGGRIYLLGGTSVINQGQENFLRSMGYDVKRLSGANRIVTTVKILEEVDILRAAAPTRVYLVNGFAPSDALSVAPLAAFTQTGILMTEAGDLSQIARDYLNVNLNSITSITIIGGTSVVPKSVEDLLRTAGYTVDRIGGQSRYDTSRMIADKFVDDSPLRPAGIGVTSGTAFADALPAGIHLAAQLYPLLLVPNDLSKLYCSATYDFMVDYGANITGGYIYGGTSALAPSIEQQMEMAISGGRVTCGQL
jgi:putative cell wall-binding protein